MERLFNKIIKEICDEKGIDIKFLSNNWIMKLQKGDQIRFISGYKFGLNTHSMGVVFDDKFATYSVMKDLDVPIIEHKIYYAESNKNDYAVSYKTYDYLERCFEQFNNDIVLKINNGSLGLGVYHITVKEELHKKYEHDFSSNASYSICPFYKIENEYRAIILGDEVKLLYKKIRPVVIGDGKLTVKELLSKFNEAYYKNYDGDNKDTVLKEGEVFEENWQFNLSRGAISSLEINDEDKTQILNIADKIIKKIDVGFGSIDIIKTVDNKFFVIEINSGVMMDSFAVQHEDGYSIAKGIYSIAIDKMFL